MRERSTLARKGGGGSSRWRTEGRHGAGEHRGAHGREREGDPLRARVQRRVAMPRVDVDVRQMHDVVDAEADHDHGGDGLADPKAPTHGPFAEAEDRGDDAHHGDDRDRCRGDVARGRQ